MVRDKSKLPISVQENKKVKLMSAISGNQIDIKRKLVKLIT